MAESENEKGATWADLFLALVYAGSALLFLVWISGITINNPPPGLKRILDSGWSWAISACGGALITLIFRNRLSKIVLGWTGVLVVALACAAFFHRPLTHILPSLGRLLKDLLLGIIRTNWTLSLTAAHSHALQIRVLELQNVGLWRGVTTAQFRGTERVTAIHARSSVLSQAIRYAERTTAKMAVLGCGTRKSSESCDRNLFAGKNRA